MTANERSTLASRLKTFSDWVHHHFLWLLVTSYLLAAVLPGPGLAIRRLSVTSSAGDEVTAPVLLLALLLFCAASVVKWAQVRELIADPLILLLGLGAVWIVPSLFVSLLGWASSWLLGDYVTNGMLVGVALVAAMPVANSSVAWCQNARGNVALGLGLIVLTIVLSPVATPQMLNLMGLALSQADTEKIERVVTQFSGMFFIIWVILPSMAGMITNAVVGEARIQKNHSWIRLVSAATLLTLNYTNASLAMPKVVDDSLSTILVSAVLAISIALLGMATALVLSRLMQLEKSVRAALVFGFSMKHTGLALVLAGEVLQESPRVILIIIMATLLQHILAGLADRLLIGDVSGAHGGQNSAAA